MPVSAAENAPLPGYHFVRATATDGTGFLTVWIDETPGREGYYATIVSDEASAKPYPPGRIFGKSTVAAVAAVWTGSSYLVAITPYLEPTTLLRLDREAQLIGAPRTIDVGGAIWKLVWNGQRVLAITNGNPAFGAAILDAEGNAIRSGVPLLTASSSSIVAEAVDGAFLVMWTETLPVERGEIVAKTRVSALRVSAEGDVSAPVELLAPAYGPSAISSASNGHEAALTVKRSWTDSVLHRFRIDASLEVDADPPLTLEPYVYGSIEAIATSRGFVAAYVDSEGRNLKVLPFGTKAVEIIPVAAGSYAVDFVSNGRWQLALWDTIPATATVFNATLTSALSPRFPIARAPARQEQPIFSSDGSLVAWNEQGTLMVRRVLDPGAAAPYEAAEKATHADLVYTGQTWLLAYSQQETGILVQRLASTGEPVGGPIALGIPPGDVTLASNGNVVALVVSDDFRREYLRLVRFSPAGQRLDATPISLTEDRAADYADIATNGEGFLVVWSHSPGYTPQVVGKRLDAAGNPIDEAAFDIATGSDFANSAAQVASDGEDYVVAYVQYGAYVIRDPPFPDDPRPAPARVFTKRVLASGVLANTTADQEGALLGFGTFPAIVHDGTRYVLTFRKDVNDELWLLVAPLDASGAPVSAPRQIARAESYEQSHALASMGGTLWTAYSRVTGEQANVQRVFLRELTEQTGRRRGSRN